MNNPNNGAAVPASSPSSFDPFAWLARWRAIGSSAEPAGDGLFLSPGGDRAVADALLEELRGTDGAAGVAALLTP